MPEPVQACVTLRLATRGDCRRLWEWRNDPAARESSFNTDYILYEDHERWFSSKIAAADTQIFIIMDPYKGEIGYVRFNIVGEQAEISVSLGETERGKGYGSAAIRKGSDYLLSVAPVQRIIASIKHSNPTSVKAFERAGFVLSGVKELAGIEAYEMIYEDAPKNVRKIYAQLRRKPKCL